MANDPRSAEEVSTELAVLARDLDQALRTRVGYGPPRTTPGFTLLGIGPEIDEAMERLEPTATTSVWNCQLELGFRPQDLAPDLNRRSRQRGVELQMIVSRRALRLNPLLTTAYPYARVAPVHLPLLLIDRSSVVLAGPLAPSGDPTAWHVTDRELVDGALALWAATWEVSEPAGRHQPSRLTDRQFDVARAVALGRKDASICRDLAISQRTLTSEVQAILAHLGARSRTEAVMRMRGRA